MKYIWTKFLWTKSFTRKLEGGNVDLFESLKSFIEVDNLQNTVIPSMTTHISALKKRLQSYFPVLIWLELRPHQWNTSCWLERSSLMSPLMRLQFKSNTLAVLWIGVEKDPPTATLQPEPWQYSFLLPHPNYVRWVFLQLPQSRLKELQSHSCIPNLRRSAAQNKPTSVTEKTVWLILINIYSSEMFIVGQKQVWKSVKSSEWCYTIKTKILVWVLSCNYCVITMFKIWCKQGHVWECLYVGACRWGAWKHFSLQKGDPEEKSGNHCPKEMVEPYLQ